MGRGPRSDKATIAPRREEGEIAFIDAERLDDQSKVAASSSSTSFGAPDDDNAIRHLITILSRRNQGLDDDQLEDQAISLYNAICSKISSGQATDTEVEKAAKLFDEDPDELIRRLQ